MKIANADLKGSGNQLSLDVTAIAPTLNWKDVSLSKVEYVTPPEDGIQDVILLATPPLGPAPTAIEIFELSIDLETADWFQGIRVKDFSSDQIWSLRNPTFQKEPVGLSPFSMQFAEIKEGKLFINIQYGGGCKTHLFQLNWDGNTMESLPPQVVLELSHNDNGDTCRALFFETFQFDLSTLDRLPKEQLKILLQSPGNIIELSYNPSHSKPSDSLDTSIAATGESKNNFSIFPKVERGYSDAYDLGEAIRDAMAKLPNRSGDIVDFLSTYRIVSIGAQVGGIAGFDRLFVDLEG